MASKASRVAALEQAGPLHLGGLRGDSAAVRRRWLPPGGCRSSTRCCAPISRAGNQAPAGDRRVHPLGAGRVGSRAGGAGRGTVWGEFAPPHVERARGRGVAGGPARW